MEASDRKGIEPERSDIRPDHWTLRLAPAPVRPYLRLARADRPIGWWLLLWPCWWGVALASEGWPAPALMALFLVGAIAMRGAGCCWNDIADRHYDGRVARTALRPIPAGEITVVQAILFMGALALIGLGVLLQLNAFAILLGMAALIPVFIYPFMKRITWWPQLFLGIAFNWGALLGWAAVRADLSLAPALLYLGGIAWTLGYDTIYAHQDKEDDALLGLKSSALRLGANTRPALWIFYGASTALIWAAGLAAGLAWPFHLALALAALHLAWQAARVRLDDPADCLAKFKSNQVYGALPLAALVLGRVAA